MEKTNFTNANVIIKEWTDGCEPSMIISEGNKTYIVTITEDHKFNISLYEPVLERYENSNWVTSEAIYCITAINELNRETLYLAWDEKRYFDNGYFWATKDEFEDVVCNNVPEHPFLFNSKQEAAEVLKTLRFIPQTCKIVRYK